MLRSLYILTLLILVYSVSAQNVGVGTITPDASAVLDIRSPDKGLLIPRMSATARQSIVDPSIGLMVFDSTNNAFYYFTHHGWLELLAGRVDKIVDADGDTKIQVEESPDEDVIRFDVAGHQAMWIGSNGGLNVKGAANVTNIALFKDSAHYQSNIIFQGSGTQYNFGTPNSDRFRLWTSSGGEALTVKPNGHIGIHWTSPDTTLHVNGSIKMVDGKQGAGKILVSDANGIAEWVDPRDEIILPDTALPVPIKYHSTYHYITPVDNAISIDWDSAQSVCHDLTAYGFDDWYLPTLSELNAMYKQSYLITGLEENAAAKYWSSTEKDAGTAYTQRLDYGGPDPDDKLDSGTHRCRCVRRD